MVEADQLLEEEQGSSKGSTAVREKNALNDLCHVYKNYHQMTTKLC